MTSRIGDEEAWPQYDVATRQRLSPTAFKVALRIGDKWGLAEQATLAMMGLPDLPSDAETVLLNSDQFYRAGLMIGVFRSLNEIFDEVTADLWPALINTAPMFEGGSAVQIMTQGGASAMVEVLQYLRAVQWGI